MGETVASILVVDDNEANRDLLTRRLEKKDYSVVQANGGRQALGLIEGQPFDLVLLDIMMPDVDGMEVLKTVRRTHSSVELPVIMVTAKQDASDMVEALALGANDYVSKPVDYQVLLARVEVQLARKRAEDALLELNQQLEQRVEQRTAQLHKTLISLKEEMAERERTEILLKKREEKFRDFSEIASDWFWETDEQHRLSFVSERIAEILGVQPEQAIGKTAWELTGADPEKEEFWRNYKANLDAHLSFRDSRYKVTDPGGKSHHMRVSGKPVFDDAGLFRGYRGTGNDETDEVESRERIDEAENQLVGITRNLPGAIFRRIRKPDGTRYYPFVSAGIYELVGLQQQDIGDGGFLSLQAIHGDDVDEFQLAMDHSARELVPVNLDYQIILDSGKTKWVHCSAYPQRLESGDILWDGLLLDITERRNLEAQLVQAQKLESIGQLAAGIAHEINTPTQYVSDNIRFLQEAFADLGKVMEVHGRLLAAARNNSVSSQLLTEVDDAVESADLEYLVDEVPRALEQAMEGLQRIIVIVSAMKQFSHPGGDDKESIDLNQVIENTITVARNEWKYVARVETDLAEDLPLLPCYRDQLSQVFLNLIVNAAHAIGDMVGEESDSQGTIRISTHQVGSDVEIRISDTGPGVPDSLRAKIFDPFFTTKEVGKGTGQGLAIARSVVVDKHDGTLDLESERGKGATFVIRLPLGDAAATGQGILG